MSIWINRGCILALSFLLSGCQFDQTGSSTAAQPRTLSVLGGALQIAAPSGYCIDKQSARQQADGAVFLMGRCNGASNVAAAVITATIGAAGSASVVADGGTALAAFFQMEAGRAALSRSGRAESVQIVQSANIDGAFALYIADQEVGDYWRAIVGISGRLVSLSVQGPSGSSLDPGRGRKLLGASLAAMRAANPRG